MHAGSSSLPCRPYMKMQELTVTACVIGFDTQASRPCGTIPPSLRIVTAPNPATASMSHDKNGSPTSCTQSCSAHESL